MVPPFPAVPALEHHADLGPRGLGPLLHGDKLGVQPAQLVFIVLAGHLLHDRHLISVGPGSSPVVPVEVELTGARVAPQGVGGITPTRVRSSLRSTITISMGGTGSPGSPG